MKKKLVYILCPIIIVFLLIISFNYTNYLSYSDRANVVELQEKLLPIMNKVEKSLSDKSKNFPYFEEENGSFTISNNIFNYKLLQNGSIISKTKKVLVIFFPVKEKNKYIWKCLGHPEKYVPLKCR